MTIVKLHFTGGIAYRPEPANSCRVTAWSAPPSSTALANTYGPSAHTLETWEECRDRFEEIVDPGREDFWSQRIVVHFAATPLLHSLCFIPSEKHRELRPTWLIQKDEDTPPSDEFLAHSPAVEEQKRYTSIESLTNSVLINNQEDINQIEGLVSAVEQEVKTVLRYFLKDPFYAILGLTYGQGAGCATRYWRKQV